MGLAPGKMAHVMWQHREVRANCLPDQRCPVQGDKRYAALLFTYGMQQINYMLGDSGRSFVIGFGKDAPQRPFHKWCVCCCYEQR